MNGVDWSFPRNEKENLAGRQKKKSSLFNFLSEVLGRKHENFYNSTAWIKAAVRPRQEEQEIEARQNILQVSFVAPKLC